MPDVLLFPGQGAQRVGMAADLAEAFPAARETLERIDAALGVNLSRVMREGPEEELTRTDRTQPAILAHSAAVLAVISPSLKPAAGAGHSLGEYSAYHAAGSLDAEDAARLVGRRGSLMFEAGRQRPGAMAAVLGLPGAEVHTACSQVTREGRVVVAANLNAPDQTVVSGDPDAVAEAGERCRAAGAKRVLPLKVSGAFHSPLMEPAVAGLRAALEGVWFRPPSFPVVANATAEPVREEGVAVDLLAKQLTAPVRWVESMTTLHRLAPDARFLEIGPGSVLKGMLKRILPEVECLTLGTASEVEAFLA